LIVFPGYEAVFPLFDGFFTFFGQGEQGQAGDAQGRFLLFAPGSRLG